jgi:hypothetical protein
VLVANLTRPVIDGVRVRVIGIRLGLQIRKTHDKHVNTNGEFCPKILVSNIAPLCTRQMLCLWILLLYTTCLFLCKNWILADDV